MNLNRTIALVFAAFLPFAAFAKGQNRKTVVQEMVVDFVENDGADVKPVVEVDDPNDNFGQIVATPSNEKIHEPLPDYTERQAVVIAKNSMVWRGEKYVADVVMLNPDPKCTYTTFLNEEKLVNGRYSVSARSVGNFRSSGYVLETDKKGATKKYPFTVEYLVTEPVAVISSNNVLFAGVLNSVNVSVPGVPISDLRIEFSNVSMSKRTSGSGFDIKPEKPSLPCIISVYARRGDEMLFVCSKEFRTLPLPRPSAFFNLGSGRFGGGFIDKDSLLTVQKVAAYLDSDLIEDVRYVVLGFDMKFADGKGSFKVLHSDSESFTAPMLKEMKKARSGTTFFVTGVKVKSPDHAMYTLSPIEVVVK
ncbi:MAG: hypothetical protein J5875_00445 [Paludibacteraceae bacterium]|nr:hypothetical protein [Paludibacteraceae bacterium]